MFVKKVNVRKTLKLIVIDCLKNINTYSIYIYPLNLMAYRSETSTVQPIASNISLALYIHICIYIFI